MQQPLSSLWAPLLIDVHNSPAQPLFEVKSKSPANLSTPSEGSTPTPSPTLQRGIDRPFVKTNPSNWDEQIPARASTFARIDTKPEPHDSTRWFPEVLGVSTHEQQQQPPELQTPERSRQSMSSSVHAQKDTARVMDIQLKFDSHCPATLVPHMNLKHTHTGSGLRKSTTQSDLLAANAAALRSPRQIATNCRIPNGTGLAGRGRPSSCKARFAAGAIQDRNRFLEVYSDIPPIEAKQTAKPLSLTTDSVVKPSSSFCTVSPPCTPFVKRAGSSQPATAPNIMSPSYLHNKPAHSSTSHPASDSRQQRPPSVTQSHDRFGAPISAASRNASLTGHGRPSLSLPSKSQDGSTPKVQKTVSMMQQFANLVQEMDNSQVRKVDDCVTHYCVVMSWLGLITINIAMTLPVGINLHSISTSTWRGIDTLTVTRKCCKVQRIIKSPQRTLQLMSRPSNSSPGRW